MTEIYQRSKEHYARYAVSTVPPLWMKGVDPQAVYPQQCFYQAYKYVTHLDRFLEEGIWLVHGECGLALGPHAWVELPDGLVFDGVFQQSYRIADWNERILGQAWYKFTPTAACIILSNMPQNYDGTYDYRWDIRLKLPWFRGTTLEIDDKQAHALIDASGLRSER